MSKFITFSTALGLSIVDVTVSTINPIVFKTAVNKRSFGKIEEADGDTFIVDVVANSATKLTTDTVCEATVSGLVSTTKLTDMQVASITASEATGCITAVTMKKAGGKSSGVSVASFCKTNGMKVDDIKVATQNDIIFSTVGLKSIGGLVKDGGKYYSLDVDNNTAKIVDAESLSADATADFIAGKNTDATAFAEHFGLIQEVTLVKSIRTILS